MHNTPEFKRDYAYYTAQFAERQREQDAFDEDFGFTKVDLAYAKALERAQHRAAPRRSWAEQKAAFKEELALRAYQHAIGA